MEALNQWEANHLTGPVLIVVPLSSWIPLRAQLWFDPDTRSIIHKRHSTPLTAREARLLTILLTAPRHFYETETLARLLRKPGRPKISPQSIRQTACGLRHKLGGGEQAKAILQGRREIGYAIFPEHSPSG